MLDRGAFQRVYQSGRRWGCPYFTAFVLRNETGRSRLGLTTPRALGKANVRNRIRRRVREAARQRFALAPAGWDIVLNPRGSALQAAFSDLEAALGRLFQELRSLS